MKRIVLLFVLIGLGGLSAKAHADDELGGIQLSSAPVTNSTGTVVAAAEPFVWPLPIIINGHHSKIVSGFGRRKVPDLGPAIEVSKGLEAHDGVDLVAPAGTPVHAARSGKVLFGGFSSAYASRVDKTEKNRLVIIMHADGLSSRYVHLDRLLVKPGQVIKSGQTLGTVGDSDEWSQTVLHFEIRDPQGHPLDPTDYLPMPQPVKKP